MLELKNICYSVAGKPILKGISTVINNGFTAITGPNGSGKSTLVKIISGILAPTDGSIILDGRDITGLGITEKSKCGISFAFQQPVKFKGITVKDLITIASGKKINVSAACDILSEVGLCAKEYINREVNASLSGGELKRIEIAMVLARATSVSIFDEPEAGIDLWSFQSLIKVFERMHEKVDGAILVVSHQERILENADRIMLLSDGQIEAEGAREAMMDRILNTDACARLRH